MEWNIKNLETLRGSFFPTEENIIIEGPLVDLKTDVIPKEGKHFDVGTLNPEDIQIKKKWWQIIPLCKKKSDIYSYIPLLRIRSEADPDSKLNYDWWTKYYDTLYMKKMSEKNVPQKHVITEEIFKPEIRPRTRGLKIYSQELEKEPEFNGFQDVLNTFTMSKTSSSGKTTTTFLIKTGIALYEWPAVNVVSGEGFGLEEGIFPSLAKELNAVISVTIRVYVVRAYKLHSKHRSGKVNPYIIVKIPSQTINDIKEVIEQENSPIFGRFFEFEGKLPFDSILTLRIMDKAVNELIGETEIDIENRYYSRHRGTCGIQKTYSKLGYDAWRDAYKPSEILNWLCLSNNLPEPRYIPGFIIVANRKFGTNKTSHEDIKEELALTVLHNWSNIPFVGRKLLEEHVETRSLYNHYLHNVEQGKLEMWVDILPSRSDLPPPVNIKPREPEKYELRVIVWATQNVKLVDEGIMVAKRHTDIYVKGWLIGKVDLQKTDVHYASLTGEGLFNWRFIFNFSYDKEEEMIVLDKTSKIPPILYLQVWDHDRFTSDDYIGALSIDLRNVQSPSRRLPYSAKFMNVYKWQVNLFRVNNVRGWWPFLGPSRTKVETVGMVDLELILLSTEDAERNPAGHGRNEPNKLPEPLRPIVKYTLWIVPFRAIKNYLWRYHKRKIMLLLLMVLFGLFVLIGFYSIPTFAVKKMLHA